MELTILMPCLNEAATLPVCINKAKSFLGENNIDGEILIADNGSTDGSVDIAKESGARVIIVPEKGYGSALMTGIRESSGEFVIMGDSDDSYDLKNLMPFLEKLRDGNDLVIGNRFRGGIGKGAMPFLHRVFGNPFLSFVGRKRYKCDIGDFNCGLRGFRRDSILSLGLETKGMEFACEMIAKSCIRGLKITEIPTPLKKDGRGRPSHLRSFSDGWKQFVLLIKGKGK